MLCGNVVPHSEPESSKHTLFEKEKRIERMNKKEISILRIALDNIIVGFLNRIGRRMKEVYTVRHIK